MKFFVVPPSAQLSFPNVAMIRFGRLAALSSAEIELLAHLPNTARRYAAHTELYAAGKVQMPRILLEGWACYQRILQDGRRQIIRFLVPGDVMGSLEFPDMAELDSVVALTPVQIASLEPLVRALDGRNGASPGLVAASRWIWQTKEREMSDQVVRLGRQSAYERLIHLILELHGRMDAIGRVNDGQFAFPLTQATLADALGTSAVHLNRTLHVGRTARLFNLERGQAVIRQLEQMQYIAA